MSLQHSEPFLRWAGGKRWLANKIAPLLANRLTNNYIEPFVGSGAMFFRLQASKASLSDTNVDLINTYEMVKTKPSELLAKLKRLSVDSATYYATRESEPSKPLDRAVRFLYLNRTCYGGLYRENRSGKFNVPYGGGSRTTTGLWERNLIKNATALFKTNDITFSARDFGESISLAGKGDVVYCDPVYHSTFGREIFDRYGPRVFDWNDHIRLANAARNAHKRGATVIISNAFNEQVFNLYQGSIAFQLHKSKTIGNFSSDQSKHKEYLFIFDKPSTHEHWLTHPYLFDKQVVEHDDLDTKLKQSDNKKKG